VISTIEASAWEPRYAGRAERMQASEIRELLKLLDRPGIITLHTHADDGRPSYALLIGLSDQSATLRAGSQAVTVSLASLATAWRARNNAVDGDMAILTFCKSLPPSMSACSSALKSAIACAADAPVDCVGAMPFVRLAGRAGVSVMLGSSN